MSRPKNKQQLLDQSEDNFSKLLNIINEIDLKEIAKPGVATSWSVKDVLAHLHEWHNMTISWYLEGVKGVKPAIPSSKYTWKDTPQLNEDIYNQYKNEKFNTILKKLKRTHEKLIGIINAHNNDELFTKKKYIWTGTTSMGAYFISATSSYYDWAIKLIKKWQKSNG